MCTFVARTLSLTINSLRSRQNGRHFTGDILKSIFVKENSWIPIEISLKFVPKSQIDNESSLVQVMACRLFGAKPLPKPMVTHFNDAYKRRPASIS